jgi:hypothetical protein
MHTDFDYDVNVDEIDAPTDFDSADVIFDPYV